MKVDGPNKTGKASDTKKKDKAQKGDGTFGAMVTGGADKAAPSKPAHSIQQVDALLAVQSVESATDRAAKKKMTQRADKILEMLDGLKVSLLTGNLTVGDVVNIADVVASHREKINDPALTAVLDEIDLRAQVEMAKLQKAMH